MKSEPNISDPDAFYEAWVAAHEGLSEAASAELDARLVLLLANQVGDALGREQQFSSLRSRHALN